MSRRRVAPAFAALLAGVACAADPEPPTGAPVARREDGYVTSSTCRACHPAQYASWHASWHRTMTGRATRSSVVGDFEDVEVRAYGRRYRLERRGDEYRVELDGRDGEGRAWRRVALTTGSHHEQDYWFDRGAGRPLGFLPLMYRRAEARWIPFSAGFLRPEVHELPPPAELDRWQTTCIKCHTTHGVPSRPDPSGGTRTTVAELGIACEACHGPAAAHVTANRNPLRRYLAYTDDARDETIANPRRLDAERSSQICGQCHGIHVTPDPQPETPRSADDWRVAGLAFRPGDDLTATRRLVDPRRGDDPRLAGLFADPHYGPDRFWNDGAVRVSGREYNGLLLSPCFERGRGERRLGCGSCHTLHGPTDGLAAWADDQLRPGAREDDACLACHERFAAAGPRTAHTHHEADSPGSVCMNCHMPYTTYGLVKAIRSHTIASPDVAESRDSGRPNACNHCHLDRTLRWTAGQLERWYGIAPPEIPRLLGAVPVSVVWALAGDAGQRALVAWSMGWEPARLVSQRGQGWMAPLLAQLLMDPYPAVRAIAARSLRRQPGFADFAVDGWAGEAERRARAVAAAQRWGAARAAAGEPLDLGFLYDDPSGALPADLLDRLHARRNDRPLSLAE